MPSEVAAAAPPATVALVGRPNVGKSALFNRLAGKRLSIVDRVPGVTRDRLYALTEWRGRTLRLVDTAGIDPGAESDALAQQTRAQAQIAAEQADLIVFVVDAAAGLSALDDDVALIMRRALRPVVLVANKGESERVRAEVPGEFARLGFGEPLVVSALHGEGTGDLLDAIVERLPPEVASPHGDTASGSDHAASGSDHAASGNDHAASGDDHAASGNDHTASAETAAELALAIIGRPNVGKSSLLNALLGEERAIVSQEPGTTRDAIDSVFEFGGQTIRLIDTAGVWRKQRHHGAIEYYASLRAIGAIARSDIAILVIDAMAGVLDGDRRLAGVALEERRGLIIVANKWDLALAQEGEFSQGELSGLIHEALPFARFAPITFLSAKTKRRLGSLMPLVMRVARNLERRVATPQLNALVRDAVYAHPAPLRGGKPLRIFYTAQVATHPPLFVFHCNDPDLVTPSYRRFLENTLRAQYDFEGVPLSLEFRPRRDGDAS